MNEINLNMTSVVVESKTTSLRTKWPRQMAKDLYAFKHFEADIYHLRVKRIQSIVNIFNIKET